MSSVKQGMVQVTNPTLGGNAFTQDPSMPSTSNTALMESLYPDSPIYAHIITDHSVTKGFSKDVIGESADFVVDAGGYWGFDGGFSPEFKGAPDIAAIKWQKGGDPATGYVPNPVSPGVGSTNPTDQTKPPEDFGTVPTNNIFGAGGSLTSPAKTSQNIAATTLGDYLQSLEVEGSLYEG